MVITVPIVPGRNFFRFVIPELQGVGFSELRDGLIAPSENAQVVAIHVLGVRDGGAQPRVILTVLHGLLRVSDRLESMHQIMLRSRISGRNCQGSLIVGNGSHQSALATACRRGLLGVSPTQPAFPVITIFRSRPANGSFIRLVLAP